jgi:2-polyprenyl-3-methyl-5-hydroxy-6-metoxy-1,4-benzoquinol methylase
MPDWQERITRETNPAVRVEHDLRYRLAEPLILGARTWCDLGCGNGVAAAETLGGAFGGRAVLVDVEQSAVETASGELGIEDTVAVAADLTRPEDLARVREALTAGDGPRVITCFEVVEHLGTFVPLLELLSELAEAGDATVLLSVPNDEFWTIENPYHETMWGEGAFAELRSLLAPGAVVARQLQLQGSIVVPEGRDGDARATVEVHASEEVPTHFLAAMGPEAATLGVHAGVAATDLDERRRWERQREADNAFLAELQRQNDEFRAELQRHYREFEDWRRYIHELEGELGRPLSGEPAEASTQPSLQAGDGTP